MLLVYNVQLLVVF